MGLYGSKGFPKKMVILLQVPVVKGVTYTIQTQGTWGFGIPISGSNSVNIGSLTMAGGGVLNSYVMGTLLGLSPSPGAFN